MGKRKTPLSAGTVPTLNGVHRLPIIGLPDPLVANARRGQEDIVANIMSLSRDAFARNIDPRRDVDDECGYPKVLTPEQYWDLYLSDPIAARVCEVYDRHAWQVSPEVYEDEDPEVATPFEEDWDALGAGLRDEPSYFKEERGSLVWEYLKRWCVVSCVNSYGILLTGLDDGLPLDQPAKYRRGQRLTFLRVFPECLAPVSTWVNDDKDPRNGRPLTYSVTFNDPRDPHSSAGGYGLGTATKTVHWTRVLHMASDPLANESFGVPRLRQVLPQVLNLKKVYGADAEGFWKACFTILAAETHPQLGGDVDVDVSRMKDMFEDMMNGLQRYGVFKGMGLKSVAPGVSDPTPHVKVQLEAICIKMNIPMRKFMGSERGELASSEDTGDWGGVVRELQNGSRTPRCVVPFVDRMVNLGVLRPPGEDGYCVDWEDVEKQTEKEKAEVANVKTTALAAYVQGGVEQIVPPLEFLTEVMGMDDETAEHILEAAEEAEEERLEEEQALADEQGMVPTLPEGFEHDPSKVPPEPMKVKEGEKIVMPLKAGGGKPPFVKNEDVDNSFCPTGAGGGVDPSCSPGEGAGGGEGPKTTPRGEKADKASAKARTEKQHLRAAQLHIEAAQDYANRGNKEMKERHMAKWREHFGKQSIMNAEQFVANLADPQAEDGGDE